jgi:thioredoxin-related protein
MPLALLAAFLAVPSVAEAGRLPKFDPSRDAAADARAAQSEAKKSGKRVLLIVGGEWCKWCHRLDAFLERNAEVTAALDKGFVVVKVNLSDENSNEALLSKLPEVKGTPHLFVVAPNGKLLKSQDTGELESGDSYDAGKFVSFLRAWSPQPTKS